MQTVTVELLNDRAINLLHELELLKIIKIHKNPTQSSDSKNWVLNYKGEPNRDSKDEVGVQFDDMPEITK